MRAARIGVLVGAALSVALAATSAQAGGKGYTTAEVLATAKKLARKHGAPADVQRKLVEVLGEELKNDSYRKAIRQHPPRAVMVYKVSEGGFIVKYLQGKGLISFQGGTQAAPIKLKSWSVGAQAGGSTQWGAGVVLGLKKQDDFGGEYRGSGVKHATAVESTAEGNASVLTLAGRRVMDRLHDLFLVVVSAKGLSAGVASAKLKISPAW